MSRFPVTNQQFAAFVADGGYQKQEYWKEGWDWRQSGEVNGPEIYSATEFGHLTQPVVGVSCYEAAAYCNWAGCRLPTEREWEAAARGKTGTAYPWGNEWFEGYCNTSETGIGKTTPVGLFPESRSSCGAEEMSGNVWQWCEDLFDENNTSRVLRGGSWDYVARNARSAYRGWSTPVNRVNDFGFRVVR
jgi:formylglycine-generating enzyme required for sulfatase activity